MTRSHRNSNSRRANNGQPRQQSRHDRGTNQGGRYRAVVKADGAPTLTLATPARTLVAPPVRYRAEPDLGHGDDLDRYAERYPDLEVFSFDDDEIDPAELDRRGLGEYVGILSNGYGE